MLNNMKKYLFILLFILTACKSLGYSDYISGIDPSVKYGFNEIIRASTFEIVMLSHEVKINEKHPDKIFIAVMFKITNISAPTSKINDLLRFATQTDTGPAKASLAARIMFSNTDSIDSILTAGKSVEIVYAIEAQADSKILTVVVDKAYKTDNPIYFEVKI